MNKVKTEYSDWQSINWRKLEKTVFKLQKRIFRAKRKGDQKLVKNLQRLLLSSFAAKTLAVRKVTQDNRGKRTAGVDGKKALTPKQRLKLVSELKLTHKAKPLRRIYIPKKNGEKRPLSIPTIHDRAAQMLTTLVLEPEWEAVFEPNSHGFRKGRSCHDAIEAIFNSIYLKPKWVLDGDISKCFDKINHEYLMEKLGDSLITIKRQIKAWLKAGYLDNQELFPSLEGTPQGGVASPLMANIALHGIENHLQKWVKTWKGSKRDNLSSFSFIRYADDFVCIHESKEVIEKAQKLIEDFLKPIGLELKPEKTQITHTLQGKGFNFLGFEVRQYHQGKHHSGKNTRGKIKGFKTIIKPSKENVQKHYHQIADTVRNNKAVNQSILIGLLNPIITGWCNYYSTVVSKETYSKLDHLTYSILRRWTQRRHPNKGKRWVKNKYFKTMKNRNWAFSDGKHTLKEHSKTPITRHTKVKGIKSPYDGDRVYWGKRLSKSLELTTRQQKLLKSQKGICSVCQSHFKTGDLLEVDHIIPRCKGGKDTYNNLQLLHAHCHDKKTASDGS